MRFLRRIGDFLNKLLTLSKSTKPKAGGKCSVDPIQFIEGNDEIFYVNDPTKAEIPEGDHYFGSEFAEICKEKHNFSENILTRFEIYQKQYNRIAYGGSDENGNYNYTISIFWHRHHDEWRLNGVKISESQANNMIEENRQKKYLHHEKESELISETISDQKVEEKGKNLGKNFEQMKEEQEIETNKEIQELKDVTELQIVVKEDAKQEEECMKNDQENETNLKINESERKDNPLPDDKDKKLICESLEKIDLDLVTEPYTNNVQIKSQEADVINHETILISNQPAKEEIQQNEPIKNTEKDFWEHFQEIRKPGTLGYSDYNLGSNFIEICVEKHCLGENILKKYELYHKQYNFIVDGSNNKNLWFRCPDEWQLNGVTITELQAKEAIEEYKRKESQQIPEQDTSNQSSDETKEINIKIKNEKEEKSGIPDIGSTCESPCEFIEIGDEIFGKCDPSKATPYLTGQFIEFRKEKIILSQNDSLERYEIFQMETKNDMLLQKPSWLRLPNEWRLNGVTITESEAITIKNSIKAFDEIVEKELNSESLTKLKETETALQDLLDKSVLDYIIYRIHIVRLRISRFNLNQKLHKNQNSNNSELRNSIVSLLDTQLFSLNQLGLKQVGYIKDDLNKLYNEIKNLKTNHDEKTIRSNLENIAFKVIKKESVLEGRIKQKLKVTKISI